MGWEVEAFQNSGTTKTSRHGAPKKWAAQGVADQNVWGKQKRAGGRGGAIR
jgi:hypothetical protein